MCRMANVKNNVAMQAASNVKKIRLTFRQYNRNPEIQ
mgnify:CR=1 FL=1